MKKNLTILFFLIIIGFSSVGQNVGIGTNTPNLSAKLEVSGTNQGFLPPRLTSVQRNAIQNPAAGLIIWCKNCGNTGELQVYNGYQWMNLIAGIGADSITPASIQTMPVIYITASSAQSGGNISSDGGLPILEKGVVWDTLPNPIVSLSTKTIDGSGSANYTSNIMSLNADLTYFVRSYTQNSSGITYGNQLAFRTLRYDSLFIQLSKTSIVANNFDQVEITVRNSIGENITNQCTLLINNQTIIDSIFSTNIAGTYQVTAILNNSFNSWSEAKTLTATIIPNTGVSFTKKILTEHITGTWVGYSTRTLYKLSTYKNVHPNLINIEIHGGTSSDPLNFQKYSMFNSHFNVTGYPSVIVNRKQENMNYQWNEDNAVLDSALQRFAPLGIAINSSLSSSTISGTVKVKFNSTTVKPLKIVIALVENGLIYPQTNYYSSSGGNTPYLYDGVDPILNFTHNGVLRSTYTDLFGDVIPNNVVTINNVYEVPFSISISGTTQTGSTYTVVPSNSAIVAFVLDGSSNVSSQGVYNVQYAPIGTNKDFD